MPRIALPGEPTFWLARVARLATSGWRLQHARRGAATPDSIRQAMLEALNSVDPLPKGALAARDARLRAKLRLVNDVKGLWHLRGELMQSLAAHHGERQARQQLDSLTLLFDGLLPPSLHSGRAPLR